MSPVGGPVLAGSRDEYGVKTEIGANKGDLCVGWESG